MATPRGLKPAAHSGEGSAAILDANLMRSGRTLDVRLVSRMFGLAADSRVMLSDLKRRHGSWQSTRSEEGSILVAEHPQAGCERRDDSGLVPGSARERGEVPLGNFRL